LNNRRYALWSVVAVYADEGISGAKGREGRPQLDLMLKDAVRRRFDERRVFYAGAQSILDILLAGLDPENKVTEGDVGRMEALSDELRRFGEEVEAGRV
jgi:hypothetical protein